MADASGWRPEFRQLAPCENWNAQISLLTGFAAAKLMLAAGIGVLRVLPPAEDWAIGRLRRAARTLGVEWPKGQSYPEFVRGLSANDPKQLAVLVKCTVLFRGAGYLSFTDGAPSGNLAHSALAAPYAHTTAPLRRLVDRYVLEVCHSVAGGLPVPGWVKEALPGLPEEMAASARRAGGYERGVLDLAEALVLSKRVGEIFDAVLIDVHPKTGIGTFQIAEPAIEAQIKAERRNLGKQIRVRLDAVDLDSAELRFSYPN